MGSLSYIIATKFCQPKIIHPKINSRATIELNIYIKIIVLSIVRLKKRKEKIIKK